MVTEDERKLLDSVEKGSVEDVNKLLKSGISPNIIVDGWTALEKASMAGQSEVAKALVVAGADPNRADENGHTPIYWAAKNGHRDAVEMLIACGSDPERADKSGNGPLHCAAKSGHIEVVSVLLKKGARPNNACHKRETALHLAAKNGHRDIVLALVNGGADPNEATPIGDTPLMVAARGGKTSVVRVLLDHKWDREEHIVTFLCLHQVLVIAAREGHHDIVGLISQRLHCDDLHRALSYSNKSHKNDTFHKTALEWAVKNQDRYLIAEILRHEYKQHKDNKEEGLLCLQSQLTYEEDLKQTIAQFADQYPKKLNEKRATGIIALLPLLMPFIVYLYDIIFDAILSGEYFSCSSFINTLNRSSVCEELNRSQEEYTVAFIANVMVMATSLLISIIVVTLLEGFCELIREMREQMYSRHHQDADFAYQTPKYKRGKILFFCLFATMMCPPIFILLAYAFFKYQFGSTSKKDKYVKSLESAETYWGILNKFEAGIESSGQLLVQTWFVSRILFSEETQIDPVHGVIRGIVLSNMATPIEKSIGKMIISVTSVVFSIGNCYRFQKRGAITLVDMIPIYMSLFTQVVARIISIFLFFSSGLRFEIWMPVIFTIHTMFVLAIKITFEFDWYCLENTFLKRLGIYLARFSLTIFGSAASFLVYVDIGLGNKEKHKRKSIFQVNFYYLLFVLLENIILATMPLIIGDDADNLAFHKMPKNLRVGLPLLVVALWLLSCLFRIAFYKFCHPWKAINGSNVKGALLCNCVDRIKVHECEAEEMPAESDIEMQYLSSWKKRLE